MKTKREAKRMVTKWKEEKQIKININITVCNCELKYPSVHIWYVASHSVNLKYWLIMTHLYRFVGSHSFVK